MKYGAHELDFSDPVQSPKVVLKIAKELGYESLGGDDYPNVITWILLNSDISERELHQFYVMVHHNINGTAFQDAPFEWRGMMSVTGFQALMQYEFLREHKPEEYQALESMLKKDEFEQFIPTFDASMNGSREAYDALAEVADKAVRINQQLNNYRTYLEKKQEHPEFEAQVKAKLEALEMLEKQCRKIDLRNDEPFKSFFKAVNESNADELKTWIRVGQQLNNYRAHLEKQGKIPEHAALAQAKLEALEEQFKEIDLSADKPFKNFFQAVGESNADELKAWIRVGQQLKIYRTHLEKQEKNPEHAAHAEAKMKALETLEEQFKEIDLSADKPFEPFEQEIKSQRNTLIKHRDHFQFLAKLSTIIHQKANNYYGRVFKSKGQETVERLQENISPQVKGP